MEEKELTREEKLEIEEKAIQALMNMGARFSVPLNIEPKQPPRYIRWWNKHFPNHLKVWRDRRIPKSWNVTRTDIPDADRERIVEVYMRNFHIKPLFLGTIDYIRKLYIQIEYDEEKIQDQPIQESKKLFKYTSLMAEIAAVAVLNNPSISNPLSKDVQELKKFFMEHLTVPRLQKITAIINQMMNSGGFISSIRLIREVGTTKPKADLIEKED